MSRFLLPVCLLAACAGDIDLAGGGDAASDELRGGKPGRSRDLSSGADLSTGIADMSGPSGSPDLAIPKDTATLTWNAPTQNADGTALTDLAGYNVYHGLVGPITKANGTKIVIGSVTSYTFTGLASGTHYFAVAAYDTAGNESTLSFQAMKTIQP